MRCNDQSLEALLDGDGPRSDRVSEHLESCERCQARLEQLAADGDDWQNAKKWLAEGDAFRDDKERRSASWTEAMASQLLSPPSHPEMLGCIGRYDVERFIGAGGMGIVFKAFDTELHRPVAVKMLAPFLAASGAARKRFAREARAAAAVVDENVVAIHNVESDDEYPFLVMEYVAGESLHTRLKRGGALEVCEVLRIGVQIASALAAAHAQGVIHRDVKPSNILLQEGVDRVLLADFGLARVGDDASLTHTGYHPGTPQYMSPEQARGEQIDQRSDLFSLGSVLYAMCTGHAPFRAETTYGILRQIGDAEAPSIRAINPDVPEWLCHVVRRLMSKEAEVRFNSAREVAMTLEGCLSHVQQPDLMPLPQSLDNSASSVLVRRKRGAWALLAALAVATIAGIPFLFQQRTDNKSNGSEHAAAIADSETDANAEEVSTGDANNSQINRLIAQLDDDNFHTRQAAERALIAIGSPAISALEKAASSDSPEVRFRARKVLSELISAKFVFIDLSQKANWTLKQKFGRFDGNTLASLPTGKRDFDGMRFHVSNDVMMLGSKLLPDIPRTVDGVQIGQKCEKLHFLHGMSFGSADQGVKEGEQIATYVVHYDDGTRSEIPAVFGNDYRDFWDSDDSKPVTRGRVAWTGRNALADQFGYTLRLYGGTWKNPHPEKRIKSFDFVATHDVGAPFCLAVTAQVMHKLPLAEKK